MTNEEVVRRILAGHAEVAHFLDVLKTTSGGDARVFAAKIIGAAGTFAGLADYLIEPQPPAQRQAFLRAAARIRRSARRGAAFTLARREENS